MDWVFWALACALSLAATDAATKAWLSDYSARELALVRLALTGLLLSPLLLAMPLPTSLPWAFWGWIAALLPLEIAAMLLYMAAIRDHPLSLTLPYLAFTPVFVLLIAAVLLGERIPPSGAAGVLLVVIGAWLLNVEHASLKDWRSWGRPLLAITWEPGSRMMLGVAVLYGFTSTMGKGAMQYLEPEQFGAVYFILLGGAAIVLFAGARPSMIMRVARKPRAVLGVALLNAVMVFTHFVALAQVEVAYMIAVKRTSLLFGILLGAWLFHERGLASHLLAGSVMVAGVALILLA